jgi:hypothetical protein
MAHIISDFLEDYIIKLAYPLNDSCFFDGNMTFETDDNNGCLLPIKKRFFDYISKESFFDYSPIEGLLEKSFNGKPFFEMKSNAGGGISVKLRVPIEKGKNEYIELERAYYPSAKTEISKPKINQRTKAGGIIPDRGTIVELQFGVNIFPFIKQPENPHYRIMLLDRDVKKLTKHNEYILNFYTDKGETALADDASTRERSVRRRSTKKEDGQNVDFYILEKEFDYIEVATKIDGAKGMIIPKFREPRKGTTKFTFAVDIGAINTHIEYNVDGNATQAFDITEQEKQLITLNKKAEQETNLTASLSQTIKHLFIPELIGEQEEFAFPIRTAIASTKGMRDKKFALADFNMAFFYEKERTVTNAVVQTDLKWANTTSKSILIREREETVFRAYIENILLLIRNKVLINDGSLGDTSVIWFYPTNMSRPRIHKLKDLWKEVFQKYITKTKEPLYMCESTAPFYYYQKRTKANTYDGPVVTISIGREKLNITLFTEQENLELIATSNFGTSAIFGDAYKGSSKTNGFIQKFKDLIASKLETNGRLLDDLAQEMQGGSSQNIIAFFFSLENNKSLIGKDEVISFNELLANSTEFKIVFALYYATIIYHTAKLLKAKGINPPAHIIFNGTGSQVINILASMNCLRGFTAEILKKVYGESNMYIELQQDEKPKRAIARGGVIYGKQEPYVGNAKNTLLGYVLASKSTPFSYQTYESNTEGELKELQEVENFIDLFFDLNNDFDFNKNFGIETEDLPKYKRIVKEQLGSFLKEGYAQKIEKLDGDKTRSIEESLFFYPLVGALNTLASKVADM